MACAQGRWCSQQSGDLPWPDPEPEPGAGLWLWLSEDHTACSLPRGLHMDTNCNLWWTAQMFLIHINMDILYHGHTKCSECSVVYNDWFICLITVFFLIAYCSKGYWTFFMWAFAMSPSCSSHAIRKWSRYAEQTYRTQILLLCNLLHLMFVCSISKLLM